jgi:Ca-activated chloride channel family protein
MIRFAHPYFLYALLALPLMLLIYVLYRRWQKKSMALYGDGKLIERLSPMRSSLRTFAKFFILQLAYIFLVIGIADPQIGSRLEKVERKGMDIMIALDVSNSMLSEDILPNRLERAKQSISKLIEELRNDRLGIIVFAGKAFTQLPITTDYAAAKMFVSSIDPGIVPVQGTSISEAIRLAEKSFNKEDHSKAIIIITDGEDHEGEALEAAKACSEKGIKLYTIGMGLPEGSPIPLYNNGVRSGFKKDKKGQTIISRLNENMLQQIAAAGNGIYVRANNSNTGLKQIFNEIDSMEKKEFESRMFSDYEDRFQYFLFPALLLIILEILLLNRKSKWAMSISLFKA